MTKWKCNFVRACPFLKQTSYTFEYCTYDRIKQYDSLPFSSEWQRHHSPIPCRVQAWGVVRSWGRYRISTGSYSLGRRVVVCGCSLGPGRSCCWWRSLRRVRQNLKGTVSSEWRLGEVLSPSERTVHGTRWWWWRCQPVARRWWRTSSGKSLWRPAGNGFPPWQPRKQQLALWCWDQSRGWGWPGWRGSGQWMSWLWTRRLRLQPGGPPHWPCT